MRRALARSAAWWCAGMRARFTAPTDTGGAEPPQGRAPPPGPWWRSGLFAPPCFPPAAPRPRVSRARPPRHYRGAGNAALARPVVDMEIGYCLAPMDQGIRLTTGVEFAAPDAAPTPVQFDRLLPAARSLFPLGEAVEA